MSYKAKAKLAALLRKHSIPYSTSIQGLIIGHVTILFEPGLETIQFIDNRFTRITFTTHYYQPDTLLSKYFHFCEMMKQFVQVKSFFESQISLN